MIVRRMSKVAFVAMSFAIISLLPLTPALAKPQAKAKPATAGAKATTAGDADAAEVKVQLQALEKALEGADAKKLADLWAEDGTYVDEDGAEFKGRAALINRFDLVFSEHGKMNVEFVPDTTRMLAGNVALSEGLVNRKGGGGPSPETRYSIVFVKKGGVWQISTAIETPLIEENFDPLNELSWLVGDWGAEQNGGSVKMSAEWAGNKGFIVMKFDVKKTANAKHVESRQIIGWDPRTEQPVSWHFDSTGGFGYGTWVKHGGKWLVESTGVERDGSVSAATNVLSLNDPNSFYWQSINRTVDGVPFTDTAQLKVERVTK